MLHNTILTPAGSGVATPGVAALGAPGPSRRDTRCGAICQVNTVSVHSIRSRHQYLFYTWFASEDAIP